MIRKLYISQKKWREWWKRDYKKKTPHWALSFEPSKLAIKFIKFLKKYKITKGKILEIGCGNGRDSLFFAHQGFDVIGIDIVPEAIALCKKKRNEFIKRKIIKKSQTKFLIADAEKLPFKNESFIGSYSLGVFHSLNLEKSLKELSRVIKKDGLVVIHIFEKTLFLPSKKLERSCSPVKIKKTLKKFPFRVLDFQSGITRRKPDYEEELGFHKHFSMVIFLQKKAR